MSWISKMVSINSGASIASLSTISGSFDSLFKVLCIFPSRYLSAIGLPPLFSFGWNSPPSFGLHSQTTRLMEIMHSTLVHINVLVIISWSIRLTGLSPSMVPLSKGVGSWDVMCAMLLPKTTFPNVIVWSLFSSKICLDFKPELFPTSLAATKGILVGFFSSTDWYA